MCILYIYISLYASGTKIFSDFPPSIKILTDHIKQFKSVLTASTAYINILVYIQNVTINILLILSSSCMVLTNTACKRSRCPMTGRGGPWGAGRLRLRIFLTFGTMKVVRSSPLRTSRLYPRSILVLIFRG